MRSSPRSSSSTPGAQIEGDGAQASGQAAAAPTEDDRVAQLERLAKLKGPARAMFP